MRKKTAPKPSQTAESSEEPPVPPVNSVGEPEDAPHQSSPIQLELAQFNVGVAQSTGIQRDHNEDALASLTTILNSGEKNMRLGLFLVADGMGGHENGEIASQVAAEKITSHVISALIQPMFSSLPLQEFSLQELLRDGINHAHLAIRKEAVGGGSTLTAALILGDQMTIAHVGDSRAYLLTPDGKFQLLTHDHSLVKRLEEIGQITPEQVSTHPQRNVLYRALGQGDPVEPDIATYFLSKGSRLLICSDGLWGVISEAQLQQMVSTKSEPQLLCQSLVNLANSSGGPDNISVILVEFLG